MPSFVHALYFWFSLIFLISRTLAVSLYSAGIHDESKRPMQAFRAVPREAWNLEVRRFSDEVNDDTVALSGMKFFYLTRKLVLSVSRHLTTKKKKEKRRRIEHSTTECSAFRWLVQLLHMNWFSFNSTRMTMTLCHAEQRNVCPFYVSVSSSSATIQSHYFRSTNHKF